MFEELVPSGNIREREREMWGWGWSSVGWASSPAHCWQGFRSHRFNSPVWRGSLLTESTFTADSQVIVFVQPPCAITCINIYAYVTKSKAMAAIPLFGHTEKKCTLGQNILGQCLNRKPFVLGTDLHPLAYKQSAKLANSCFSLMW